MQVWVVPVAVTVGLVLQVLIGIGVGRLLRGSRTKPLDRPAPSPALGTPPKPPLLRARRGQQRVPHQQPKEGGAHTAEKSS
jgi:hypothetical protein